MKVDFGHFLFVPTCWTRCCITTSRRRLSEFRRCRTRCLSPPAWILFYFFSLSLFYFFVFIFTHCLGVSVWSLSVSGQDDGRAVGHNVLRCPQHGADERGGDPGLSGCWNWAHLHSKESPARELSSLENPHFFGFCFCVKGPECRTTVTVQRFSISRSATPLSCQQAWMPALQLGVYVQHKWISWYKSLHFTETAHKIGFD